MGRTQPASRRSCRVTLQAEALESRKLLTGGAGDTFGELSAQINSAGGGATVEFRVSPKLFKAPEGKMVLGLDVGASSGSSVDAQVDSLTGPKGQNLAVQHGQYGPVLQAKLNKSVTSAGTVALSQLPTKGNKSATYTVNVSAANQTQGALAVGFYLPGDANGDGSVKKGDIKAIQKAIGAQFGDTNYNLNDDANRDGVVNEADVKLAKKNLGVSTVVTPVATASIDSALLTNSTTRTVSQNTMPFSGTATPGSTITISEINNLDPPVTTTANSKGQFQTTLALAAGSNTFSVVVTDAFGQLNQGVLLPLVYQPPQ